MGFTSQVLVASITNALFLPHTVKLIDIHCWLPDTGATVAAAKLTSFCLLSCGL